MTTKTETKDTASTTNPFPTFDPMTAWPQAQQAFHKMMTDAHGRAQAFAGEYAALEAQLLSRAHAAIESWAKLAQDALDYSAQLSVQARKLGTSGLGTASKINAGA